VELADHSSTCSDIAQLTEDTTWCAITPQLGLPTGQGLMTHLSPEP
jgi:hypothetical protein